jgi:peroxiredoxin Q/BCP
MLKAGDSPPPFCVQTDDSKEVTLEDYRGRDLVIFFFPKANTPG